MFTSNYARIKRLPADLRPIAISIKPPYWYRGPKELRLAPTAAMLQMTRVEYDKIFLGEILPSLDPQQVYNELGDNAVLLCYESPNVWCHRRAVAEWLETSLGIAIPEFGFDRSFSLPYAEMPEKAVRQAVGK